jgi:UDP-2,3-diacylglucosamine hydrolase
MMKRIAILAGGGNLPLVLAKSIVRQGGRAHIVAVRGEAGPQIEAFPHTWVTWGSVNAILATLKRESDGTMMIAGSVSRPDLMRVKPDFGLIRHLPKVLAMLRGGDDAVLTRLIRFFESQGLTVSGVAEIAPELIVGPGRLGAAVPPSASTEDDIARGFAVLDALSDLDVGQAIVVERGRVLAIEGVEGTDRMLARIAGLQGRPEARPGSPRRYAGCWRTDDRPS